MVEIGEGHVWTLALLKPVRPVVEVGGETTSAVQLPLQGLVVNAQHIGPHLLPRPVKTGYPTAHRFGDRDRRCSSRSHVPFHSDRPMPRRVLELDAR